MHAIAATLKATVEVIALPLIAGLDKLLYFKPELCEVTRIEVGNLFFVF